MKTDDPCTPQGRPLLTSAANPTLKRMRALAQRKTREETNLFAVEGARHVSAALDHGWRVDTLLFDAAEEASLAPFLDRAAGSCPGLRLAATSRDLLARATRRDNPQSVLAAVETATLALSDLTAKPAGLWIGLDRLKDPGNLGTILRTAHAVGADGAVLIGETCDPFGVEAVRGSMGSLFAVPIARVGADAFKAWRAGWPGTVIGTAADGEVGYRRAPYGAATLLLMGSESHGLSADLRAACDAVASIPIHGGAESLNVGVASALMLYAAREAEAGVTKS